MKLPDLTTRQWVTTVVLWFGICSALGVLVTWPALELIPDDTTELKLVIRSSGKLIGECRELDSASLEKLPANMRQARVCPREKSPLLAELLIDEAVVVREDVYPSGLHSDGVLAAYRLLRVPTGPADVELRIREDMTVEGFTHSLKRTIDFLPGHIVVIHYTDSGIKVSGV